MAIYSGFSHEKWWFSIAMLVHQRVWLFMHVFYVVKSGDFPRSQISWLFGWDNFQVCGAKICVPDKSDVLVHLACTLSQNKHGNNRTQHFSRFWMIYILKTDSFMLNGHTWAHNETLKIKVRFGTCDLPRWFCYISVITIWNKQTHCPTYGGPPRYTPDMKWIVPTPLSELTLFRVRGLMVYFPCWLVIWCYYWLNPPHFGGCTPILGCWLVKTVQSIFLL